MAYEPIPQPLLNVLKGVLHANLFSTWRNDLVRWDMRNPEQSSQLRRQLAMAALTDAVDPTLFLKLTGHWVTDAASTRAWFTQVYTQFYGRPPEPFDIA